MTTIEAEAKALKEDLKLVGCQVKNYKITL